MTSTQRKKGAVSLAVAKARNFFRFVRLRAGIYRGWRADIANEHTLGKVLAALADCQHFRNYVEIGTAHGLGSTKVIGEKLLARSDSCCLWTVEAVSFLHAVAVRNWRDTDLRGRVIFVHGAVASDAVMTYDEVLADANYKADKNDYSLASYENNKTAADNAPDAMPHLPNEIDVLLLDGGEFNSYGEYRALAGRSKVICLDDVAVIKNRRVREELLTSDEWVLAAEKTDERHGWSVFCRPEWQGIVTPICIGL